MQRIPFSAVDEARIASTGTWSVVMAAIGVGSALVLLVVGAVAAVRQTNPTTLGNLALELLSLLLNAVLGLWLFQAGQAFRKVARSDEADQAYLLAGFAKLRLYFMLTGILIITLIGLGLLAFLGLMVCSITR